MLFIRNIMKNLKPYNYHDTCIGNNSYEFFETIFKSKRDADLKTYFENNKTIVGDSHQLYDTKFKNNLLPEINQSNGLTFIKDNFETLYSYTNSKIKKLRVAIKNLQDITIKNKCQYCTINDHNTLDHFLPRATYWEYVIHPLNLVPCCSACNSKMSDKENASLNLYLDTLPTEQYLFVNVTFIGSIPNFDFELKNVNNNTINAALYVKIKQHFVSLGLLERMKKAALTEYTEFYNSIKAQLQHSNISNIKSCTLRTIQNNKISYGHNHWKYIFQETLINSQTFINLL